MPASSIAIVIARAGLVAGRIGLGDVRRVGRDAVAEQLRVDLRAARLRALELLEHEHGRRLADHEPVAPCVERPRRALRVVVPPRERAHRVEAGDRHLASPAPRRRPRTSCARGRAGSRRARRRSPCSRRRTPWSGSSAGPSCRARSTTQPAPMFGMIARDRERADPVGPAVAERVVRVLERVQAADPGRDRRADVARDRR